LVAGTVVLSVVVSALLEPVLPAGEEQGLQPDVWRPDRVGAFVLNGIVVATVVPFAEELFFRGLGCRAFLLFGSVVSVLATGLLFALAHGILVAVPALGIFGLLLGWLRLRSDSVWPCVLAHGVYNGVGVIVFYVTAIS
jgi:membrane protease YdiL (CAAX protease family)